MSIIWGIKKDEKKKSNSKRSMVVIFVCGSGGASILFPSTRDMVRGDSLVLWTTDIMWWSWWTGIIYMKRETKLISGIRNFNLISILSGEQWQFLLI